MADEQEWKQALMRAARKKKGASAQPDQSAAAPRRTEPAARVYPAARAVRQSTREPLTRGAMLEAHRGADRSTGEPTQKEAMQALRARKAAAKSAAEARKATSEATSGSALGGLGGSALGSSSWVTAD